MSAEAQWLSDITFFNLLDEDERAVLSKQVEAQRFPAGTVIFKAGDSGNAMYVIRTGSVEILLIDEDKERVVVAVFSDGDFFGELSLLDEEPRSSTATALKDTDVVLIDREDLRLLFTQKPHAALDMLAMIGKRLRENDKLISSRAARNANEVIDEELTFGQRLADKIASFGGSWPFIIRPLAKVGQRSFSSSRL
jgi:CRP/FNR family transcriptional regulator, cyclic AMP receptor protein